MVLDVEEESGAVATLDRANRGVPLVQTARHHRFAVGRGICVLLGQAVLLALRCFSRRRAHSLDIDRMLHCCVVELEGGAYTLLPHVELHPSPKGSRQRFALRSPEHGLSHVTSLEPHPVAAAEVAPKVGHALRATRQRVSERV